MRLQGQLNTWMIAFSTPTKSHFEPRLKQNVILHGLVPNESSLSRLHPCRISGCVKALKSIKRITRLLQTSPSPSPTCHIFSLSRGRKWVPEDCRSLYTSLLQPRQIWIFGCLKSENELTWRRHLETSLCRTTPRGISTTLLLKISFKALKHRFLNLAEVPISVCKTQKSICKASWLREWSLSRPLQSLILRRRRGWMLLCRVSWPQLSSLSRHRSSRILGCAEGIK